MAVIGRPALYTTDTDMIMAVEDYFIWIQGEYTDQQRHDENGAPYTERIWSRYPEPPTITGLALHLGFESRQSIYDYEKNGDFSYIIKNARLRVEKGYELALHGDKPTGSIFALKNMGWTDKTQTELTGKDGEPLSPPVINIQVVPPKTEE